MREVLHSVFYVLLINSLQSVFGNDYLNIALNKNATQVSTRNTIVSRFGPRNANDGKRNQVATKGDCTHTTDTDPVKWWTVDFGKLYTIESVRIYARTDCCHHDLRSLYVGASDETKEGEWKWVTKTTISGYFNFQPGQPNNIDSNHPNKVANCGAVMSKGELDLYDVYCYGKRQFICEM